MTVTEALDRIKEAAAALANSNKLYDTIIIYEDLRDKVNDLFRVKWESFENKKED